MNMTEFEHCTGIKPETLCDPDALFKMLETYCSGWMGADFDFPHIFGRYGHTEGGMRYGFYWNDKHPGFTPEDFFQMVALSYIYWKPSYEKDFHELFTVRHMIEIRKYLDTLPPEERQPTFDSYPEEIKEQYKKVYQRQNGELIF